MKTINLMALIIALMISSGGFAAIDLLFAKASSSHQQSSVELVLKA